MPEWGMSLLNWLGLGAGAGGGFAMFKWLLEFIGGRVDKRADLIDKGTEKLIFHLEKQISTFLVRLEQVEEALDECKKSHRKCEEEIARLRGVIQGTGDARQIAALIIASEKEKAK